MKSFEKSSTPLSGNPLAARFVLIAVMLVTSQMVFAGTGGQEFDAVWTTFTDWTQGNLGRIIAGAFMLVGSVGGILRGSLMFLATGIGAGLGLYNAPTIVSSIMTATVQFEPSGFQF